MDIFVFFPLLERVKNPAYIEKLSFKRCLELTTNHGKQNEWESAITWYDSKKNELENKLKPEKNSIAVNTDKVIDDFFEKKKDPVTEKLSSLFNF